MQGDKEITMSKYAHYAEIDPEFAALKADCDANFAALWDMPLNDLKAAWRAVPPVLGPYVSEDIDINHQNVAVRDGTEIDIRVYKAKNVPEKAPLFLVAHGGGWAVGSHGVEEATCRIVAEKAHAVVVSVDYRL
jgi:acetyl esterase/lipase